MNRSKVHYFCKKSVKYPIIVFRMVLSLFCNAFDAKEWYENSDDILCSCCHPNLFVSLQTFSLRNIVGKTVATSTPLSTANRRSRTPVRVGPTSPIVISPTPSPDADDDNETSSTKPEFKSWRHRQSAEKKELVNRLRDTLFKFCEDNLEYSKCLHIRGDILVIYDDNSLSAEFDKHLHGDDIAKDKRIRSQNEAARARKQAFTNQVRIQPATLQPIIQSVTSLATTSAPTTVSSTAPQVSAKTTTAGKRAAGLDRIIGSWYARPEEGSNDSDADSIGE